MITAATTAATVGFVPGRPRVAAPPRFPGTLQNSFGAVEETDTLVEDVDAAPDETPRRGRGAFDPDHPRGIVIHHVATLDSATAARVDAVERAAEALGAKVTAGAILLGGLGVVAAGLYATGALSRRRS